MKFKKNNNNKIKKKKQKSLKKEKLVGGDAKKFMCKKESLEGTACQEREDESNTKFANLYCIPFSKNMRTTKNHVL